MEFSKKEAYALQIGFYIKNNNPASACSLSKEMIKKFPNEPLSHFIAARALFFAGKYGKANLEGRKAFNLSHQKSDLMRSAMIIASSLFMLGRYQEGFDIIKPFRNERNANIKKLLLLFSAALEKGADAALYYEQLDSINHAAAQSLIRSMAKKKE